MSTSIASQPVTFHISLNVADIDRSVAFFSRLFGTPPAKHRPDYAKFELTNPPLTFSLEPSDPAARGALNHVGFKLDSSEELVAMQRRLEAAGIRSQREEGVECCYARQTKFWLHDPDGALWELYVLEGDIEHRGDGQDLTTVLTSQNGAPQAHSTTAVSAPQKWSHRLGSSLAIPSEIQADSLEEIDLQGTFNGAHADAERGSFLKQAAGRLKPGGVVRLHCLTADRHVEELPTLPGPAAVVKTVPCLNSLVNDLENAGFAAIRLTKYGSRACFTAGAAELRETKIEAIKPVAPQEKQVAVVYRGPFPQVTLDSGETLQRGRAATLSLSAIELIRNTPVADSLVILEQAVAPVSCTG